MDLASLQTQLASEADNLPPVDDWDPPFCGDIDLHITRDGRWWYQGSPIGRQSIVKLFAGVLKRVGEDYFLVTPVEKVGIRVEDAPFIITEWDRQSGVITATTNIGDTCVISDVHPVKLQFDEASQTEVPYVNVRRNLWARCHQNVFYQWAAQGEEKQTSTGTYLTLTSGEYTFTLGKI